MFETLNQGKRAQTAMLTIEDGTRYEFRHFTIEFVPRKNLILDSGADLLNFHMIHVVDTKNNIILEYCIIRVLKGYSKKIVMNFMSVAHTRFAPDRIFGRVRTIMGDYEAFCVPGFEQLVRDAAENSYYFVFDHRNEVRDS